MEQIARSVKVQQGYEIHSGELLRLMKMTQVSQYAAFEALCIAYCYGYALGGRAEKAAAKKKRERKNRISAAGAYCGR
ncbi:MAG: hypothetical protein IJG45_00935 [Oscillospiraceae bacterium]|nr:hypothetical protein [Oscillospiraceae bacterium]